MKHIVLAGSVTVLALGAPRLAAANPSCGSSGGGSTGTSSPGTGSGGGGWGGHHGGVPYGTTHYVVTSECEDESDVVGYRRCKKYGDWGTNLRVPHVLIEGGVAVRQFGTLLGSQSGTVLHGAEQFSYRVAMPSSATSVDTAVLSTLRIGAGLSHNLYAAAEVDGGAIAQPAAATMEMADTGVFGSPDLSQRRGFVVDALAAVGFRGATHAGGLGVEFAGGLRTAWYNFHSSYHDCEQSTSVSGFAPVAEVRARGELWLSPWLTAGATIGTSVLERHTWMGGLYLGVHTRAFGGDR
jgi:hypothetical protein